jgi:hypothetical protein
VADRSSDRPGRRANEVRAGRRGNTRCPSKAEPVRDALGAGASVQTRARPPFARSASASARSGRLATAAPVRQCVHQVSRPVGSRSLRESRRRVPGMRRGPRCLPASAGVCSAVLLGASWGWRVARRGGHGSWRAQDEPSRAVGTDVGHVSAARGAERAFVAAYHRGSIQREGLAASLAGAAHFEHGALSVPLWPGWRRRGTCFDTRSG